MFLEESYMRKTPYGTPRKTIPLTGALVTVCPTKCAEPKSDNFTERMTPAFTLGYVTRRDEYDERSVTNLTQCSRRGR